METPYYESRQFFLGTQIGRIDTKSAVRTSAYSYSSNMVAFTTDKAMGQECEIIVVDSRDSDHMGKYQLL